MEIKKTSQQWYLEIPKSYGFIIMDPDGWDRKNYDFSFNQELITKPEFIERTHKSTCIVSGNMPITWFEEWVKNEPKRFFISDTHFDDSRFDLFYRPFKTVEEQDNFLVEKWNSVVGLNDDVYLIGDAAVTDEGLKNIKRLNGRKHLIIGNYDEPRDKDLLNSLFDSVRESDYIKLSNGELVYLNHYPGNAKNAIFNLVGHIHGLWKVQRNMINVSADAWHFTPISEEQILFCMNGIRKFYDVHVFAGELEANVPQQVLYTGDKIKKLGNTIFLAGPSPRDSDTESWRPAFIKQLFDSGFRGTIINPENKEFNEEFNYDNQVNWEDKGLNAADLIIFWVPRDLDKLPGFTTNVEYGEWMKSGKVILGYPEDAAKMNYLAYKAYKYNLTIVHNTKQMCKAINDYFRYKEKTS